MLQGPLPEIDPYEYGELAIPRTSLATFNRHVVNGQIRPEYAYLYRVDWLQTRQTGERETDEQSMIFRTLGTSGHQYENPLDNLPSVRDNSPEYLREMHAYVSKVNEVGQVARGLYYYCGLDGARLLQAKDLLLAGGFTVDRNGIVKFLPEMFIGDDCSAGLEKSKKELLRAASIVSRVRVEFLPNGMLFPDPITPDSPKAVVHIIRRDANAPSFKIPPESIDVFVDGNWKNLLQVDLERVVREAGAGQIGRILTF